MRKVFGPLPERTPLKPVLMGVLQRDGYRVEKIILESRPGFPVTANLYIPEQVSFPAPCVLGTCGHSLTGKAEPAYQSFCQGLVKKGYVVLIYDPISQGERLQYMNDEWKSAYGVGVGEHVHSGNQQLLLGEFFGTWRVWDGIRCLDYLLDREETDPTRVGLTGNSGGGTLTTLLLANDDRFTMAGPGCYVTTFRRNAENELPADSEQIPPNLLALGMDMDDMLACHAPKPLILLTQEKDYFDQRGSLEAFARLKHLYKLLGAHGDPRRLGLIGAEEVLRHGETMFLHDEMIPHGDPQAIVHDGRPRRRQGRARGETGPKGVPSPGLVDLPDRPARLQASLMVHAETTHMPETPVEEHGGRGWSNSRRRKAKLFPGPSPQWGGMKVSPTGRSICQRRASPSDRKSESEGSGRSPCPEGDRDRPDPRR